jgi:ribonuclease HII
MQKLTVKEIEAKLLHVKDRHDPFLKNCEQDERKTVQALVKKWLKQYQDVQALKKEFERMKTYEKQLKEKGYQWIAGIDEVGRGPLAGPVVAAAVILPDDFYVLGLTDSKKLSEKKRDEYYQKIMDKALDVGVGIVQARDIDKFNIYEATKIAMKKAIHNIKVHKPDYLLIDAMKLPVNIPQTSIVKGDAKSISIAASSIVAKVTRDRYMRQLAEKYPQYGFEHHMGYGTKQHLEALKHFGATKEHRLTFAPVKTYIKR